MANKKLIKKLADELKKGDLKAIAELAGFTPVTISKFFNGGDDLVSDEAAAKIIEAFEKVMAKRARLIIATEKKINKILKSA
jgi:uncharacterized protein (DUF1697 family)